MPLRLTGEQKTSAKRRILALATPRLASLGFRVVAGGRTGGTFELRAEDGARLVLSVGAPTFDSLFRLWTSWEREPGVGVGGPTSDAYRSPNTPGRRRYTFRFHGAPESHERCAREIEEWARDELLPWFAQRPERSWSNPRVRTS